MGMSIGKISKWKWSLKEKTNIFQKKLIFI